LKLTPFVVSEAGNFKNDMKLCGELTLHCIIYQSFICGCSLKIRVYSVNSVPYGVVQHTWLCFYITCCQTVTL